MSLFHASTCFEHMCPSSGGQYCTIQPLVSSQLYVAVPCTGRPPMFVMIPEAVYYNIDLLTMGTCARNM